MNPHSLTIVDFFINSGNKKFTKSSKDLDWNFWEDLKIEYTILNHECAIWKIKVVICMFIFYIDVPLCLYLFKLTLIQYLLV